MSLMRLPALITFLLSVTLAAPALSEDAPLRADGEMLVLTALGHELAWPRPDWLESGTPEEDLNTSYRSDAGQTSLTVYPQGETEAFWTERSGSAAEAVIVASSM